ncbi:citrate synthase [Alkalicoccobacillus porphyridii]|uniref:Citrate synthase n=1 Tax=Alkalicoccobacillus porphyridii TaxID=2597270 RepID=A0A554A2Z1_9BACI|nr:citrate synthase [Alkalicoccobacillus porphyridii]TSB48035.1 citrate synthase [Alkalicoccobacillus porphyridii]
MTSTKGLEGIVATTSSVSSIIDDVLTYQGYDINDLTKHASFEEVVYILWNGKLPNKSQLTDFSNELMSYAEVPQQVIDQLKSLPLDKVHPMGVLRTAISTLGLFDEDADKMDEEANRLKALKIQAQIPTIVTAFSRIRQGQEPVKPNKELSFAANFLYMLKGELPEDLEVTAFNKALVLHADHELNASTFTARVCVATLSDVYSGMTAAIGALKGPLHGGANEAVMKMLSEIGDVDHVESYIKNAFEKKEKIMGFGHRVYKNGDPRAKFLRDMSKQLTSTTGETKWYEISLRVEELVKQEKGLLPNVDFYSASVYHSLGIEHDLFTPIFAISRTSGWTAHILEQYANNRLIRPRAEYVGPGKQEYVAVEQR